MLLARSGVVLCNSRVQSGVGEVWTCVAELEIAELAG